MPEFRRSKTKRTAPIRYTHTRKGRSWGYTPEFKKLTQKNNGIVLALKEILNGGIGQSKNFGNIHVRPLSRSGAGDGRKDYCFEVHTPNGILFVKRNNAEIKGEFTPMKSEFMAMKILERFLAKIGNEINGIKIYASKYHAYYHGVFRKGMLISDQKRLIVSDFYPKKFLYESELDDDNYKKISDTLEELEKRIRKKNLVISDIRIENCVYDPSTKTIIVFDALTKMLDEFREP